MANAVKEDKGWPEYFFNSSYGETSQCFFDNSAVLKEDELYEILMKIETKHQQLEDCLLDNNNEQLKQRMKDLGIWPSESDECPPGTFFSPMDCKVSEVFVKDEMNVKKGEPMLVLDAPLPPSPTPAVSSCLPMRERQKRRIKKVLEEQLGAPACTMEHTASDVTSLISRRPAYEKTDAAKIYENFKKFDTVVDHSDHLFSAHTPETQQPPMDWVNKVHEERRILQEHLPDTIFVRVYESRMDILRAAIIGQKGTPYHDGLFFFDVCFPSNYPNNPPLVRYHSGVHGINPHMNNCGDVRLLFYDARARQEKMWVPGTSNMLQLLVSIQGLILNTQPYFNGLANASLRGSVIGERWSFLFNENTVIKTLETMVYTMNRPPKNFEDLVVGHFHGRVHDILMACKAYMEGLQEVGCLVSDGNHRCSSKFKKDVVSCIKPLVEAFNKIGAKVAQEYLYLTEKKTALPANVPTTVNDAANKKRKADSEVNDAANKKRKVVVDEGMSDSINQESKVTISSPGNCLISKVFVCAGMEVEKGRPLFVLGERKFEDLLLDHPSRATTKEPKVEKSTTRSILLGNRRSRVGIFAMEEVLVDQELEDSSPMARGLGNEEDDVLKTYENFKNFDTVADHSDHIFSARNPEEEMYCDILQPPIDWVNNIHEERRNLEKHLPQTIFVRVYKSRMDLLRAVIIGPQGTPYRDGLFFFDVCFPSNYPFSPPLLHYHSGGLCVNPNLYKCGKVNLSLPKTSGGQELIWEPGTSTMLELLVSIQNRILNANPIFNEVTYARMKGSVYGEQSSLLYNENTVVKSLKTMAYLMNKPPKNFEDFVVGHFRNCARDVMMTCNKKTRSMTFKNDLMLCMKLLVATFKKIGVNVSPEFLPSS